MLRCSLKQRNVGLAENICSVSLPLHVPEEAGLLIDLRPSDERRTAFRDAAPCKTTIYNRFAEFKRGRVNLSNEFRDCCPCTIVNNKKIDAVSKQI
ncbi:hypothetical protein EVAR_44074_1 [Eumeta japonica]|uniref:Uncharacterized protein n=1 Tax=Eumeta variegata TaxID=151549 RepID=A0A4C1X4N1_EUMVA|nr:hypothetical protein EVAR_44074_1 [Eumeta japonica]